DLYYRLHVIELSMPSLREMREDIPLIANAILAKLSRNGAAALESEASVALERYPFPGNVRELENILERGLSLAADSQHITAEDLHLTPVADETDVNVPAGDKSEEHTSELQSRFDLVCRLPLEKKNLP